MQISPIFGKHKLLPGEHRFFSTDFFSLGVKRDKEGWLLQHSDSVTNESDESDFSSGDFFQTGKSNSLLILPSLPSKPLVFKGSGLHVSPGQKLVFFLKIPLTIDVFFSKSLPANLLREIPVKRLSDTWFGEPSGGEPAFSLGSEFFLSENEVNPSSFESICPVTIYNNSPGVLKVERLIIRVENMTLYRKDDKILTSLLAIEYKGREVISSAAYHYSKIYHGEKEEVMAKPRSWASKHLLKINFHFIRNFLQT
jgi:hypothetical protein